MHVQIGRNTREGIRYLRGLYGVGCTFNVLINSFLVHRIERPFLSFMRSRGRTQEISSMKLRVNLSWIGINKVLELIAPVSDAGLTADLIEFGIREPLHVKYMYDVIHEYRPVVLDIGSNIGYFPLIELEAGARHVIAVEPLPLIFNFLKINLKKYSNKVILLNNAVDINDNICWIHIPISSEGKPLYNHAHIGCKEESEKNNIKIKVRALSFSKLLNSFRPNMIRMDIEGYEWRLLSSIKDLPSNMHIIDLEAHPDNVLLIKLSLIRLLEEGFKRAIFLEGVWNISRTLQLLTNFKYYKTFSGIIKEYDLRTSNINKIIRLFLTEKHVILFR